ncbi:hypothetical protein FHX75_111220 [Micromonospora palomenae]|uniref:Myo-inositol-1(Or 4)-monophosphatase n=1 Tax=Micromonospora palomenae TaxID=1461247 RepID=A0A561WW42_9ACTN|nr:hypothetical protein [Micromonospora palomenae]TWG28069.1 hypothetical protein FHX75_111220 [Micromonospora palomenae]
MADELARIGASALRQAAMRTLRHLETSGGWKRLLLAEGELHLGDDPIQADEEAQVEFGRAFSRHPAYRDLRVIDIIGEERLKPPPELNPGERLLVLDPLDGSTQWAMIRAGYCVAAMLFIARSAGRIQLESAIIANQTHTFTLINGKPMTFGPTYGTSSEDAYLLSCQPDNGMVVPSIAFTGYKPKDRGSVLSLVHELPQWSFLTIGGNPVTPYVVAGGLTAAVTIREQAPWDAIGILMCSKTDAVVGTLNGTVLGHRGFEELFNKVALTRNTRSIPPMIVAKTERRFKEVATALAKARDSFGEGFGSGMEDLGQMSE